MNGLPVVSKKHRVTSRYSPSTVSPYGLTKAADAALDKMSAAARKAGLRLVVRSGYRSYATQAAIFKRQVATYPSEELARRYNAEPGRSEHQTGLAVDLWDGVTWGIAVSRTKVGKWLWANAHKYGFILRYPPGKEAITGYAYEPWHFRYVGTEHSRRVRRQFQAHPRGVPPHPLNGISVVRSLGSRGWVRMKKRQPCELWRRDEPRRNPRTPAR